MEVNKFDINSTKVYLQIGPTKPGGPTIRGGPKKS